MRADSKQQGKKKKILRRITSATVCFAKLQKTQRQTKFTRQMELSVAQLVLS